MFYQYEVTRRPNKQLTSLKNWASRLIIESLSRYNITIDRTIDREKLEAFFERIHPVATEHELIRIGPQGDGGYLVPDDLHGIEVCFSPGVAQIADFELDLAKRGIRSYLADFSVDGPPINSEYFEFDKKYIGPYDNEAFMTLESWMKEKNAISKHMILQMDIEGYEYDVLFQTDRSILRNFRIIIVEFHRLNMILEKGMFKLIENAFEKLLADFEIVHIHPNNCARPFNIFGHSLHPVMEFSFLRKDRIRSKRLLDRFPHVLDQQNIAGEKDYALDPSWYKITKS